MDMDTNSYADLNTLFEAVCRDLQGACLEDVAYTAACSPSTLWMWREGRTQSPRVCTLTRVSSVLGYEVTWTKPR